MTTNLLTANQSSVETDTTGFTPVGTALSRDPGHTWTDPTSGVTYPSLLVATDGTSQFQAVEVRAPVAEFTPSESITLSAYILTDSGSAGAVVRFYCQSDAGNIGSVGSITLGPAGTWTRFSVNVTTPGTLPSNYIGLRLDTGAANQALNLWLDGMMIQAGALAPWVIGGVPLNPNSLTVYVGGVIYQVLARSLDVVNQIGQRSTGRMTVWSAVGTVFAYGTQVKIYLASGTLVYSGYVDKDKAYRPKGAMQGSGQLLHDLTLMDNCYRADKRVLWANYNSVSAGAIVQNILSTILAAEGVTSLPNSIAAGPTISAYISNGKTVSYVLGWLAQLSGYWWNIDTAGVLWFQPYGGIPAPFVLDGTQTESDSDLAVTGGNEMYVNSQYVRGAYATTAVLTETIYGNGSSPGFTLSYEIASTTAGDLSIYDSSTGLTYTLNNGIGAKGATGYRWYAAIGDSVLALDGGATPLTTGQYITVTYKGRYPIEALASNAALIATQKAREGGGTGRVEATHTDTKIYSQAAAFQIAGGILSHYGQDMTVLTFWTQKNTLAEGQMLTCNLPDFALNNRQMLIQSVEMNDQRDGVNLWYLVTAVGSPYEAAQWQTWFANVMNQQADPADLADTTDTTLAILLDSPVTLLVDAVVTNTITICPIPSATLYPSSVLYPC